MSKVETPEGLLEAMQELRREVGARAEELFADWRPAIARPVFESSARNLAAYLALRRHDLRELQVSLMRWGLSSLGRSESRVEASLDAVISTLGAICRRDGEAAPPAYPQADAVFKGAQVIAHETDGIFGVARSPRQTRILVTVPTEAAEDPGWMRALVRSGVDAVRINCAHDTPAVWGAMLRNLRRAERDAKLPERLRVLMDLAGPKVRTVRPRKQEKAVYFIGDRLLLTSAADLERVAGRKHRAKGESKKHGHDKRRLVARVVSGKTLEATRQTPAPAGALGTVGCTLPEALDRLAVGQSVYIDDGRLGARALERVADGMVIEIVQAPIKGRKIRSDKGLNFPDTEFEVSSLTEKDRDDLTFVAQHADMVGYSFVQTEADIAALLSALGERLPSDRKLPALVLKIETKRAVRNLPELIIHAAGRLPTAVMIARGDLAIELGFQRIAEMQEEILWLCEAANVPVIWATQVLEALAKQGVPTRAEVTDAAMANRAECVMLNKGPYILEAVRMLDGVLRRMQGHQHKKTPQLRVLSSWPESCSETDDQPVASRTDPSDLAAVAPSS